VSTGHPIPENIMESMDTTDLLQYAAEVRFHMSYYENEFDKLKEILVNRPDLPKTYEHPEGLGTIKKTKRSGAVLIDPSGVLKTIGSNLFMRICKVTKTDVEKNSTPTQYKAMWADGTIQKTDEDTLSISYTKPTV
jgi:hypothetical protein